MNACEKWGLRFLNSLLRHIFAASGIWEYFHAKYDVNWKDLGWAVVIAAVIPTLKEFFAKGLPDPDEWEKASKEEATGTK